LATTIEIWIEDLDICKTLEIGVALIFAPRKHCANKVELYECTLAWLIRIGIGCPVECCRILGWWCVERGDF